MNISSFFSNKSRHFLETSLHKPFKSIMPCFQRVAMLLAFNQYMTVE